MRLRAPDVSQQWNRIPAIMQRKQQDIGLVLLIKPIQQRLLFREETQGIRIPKSKPKIIEYS
jgi:hypothetical protein